MLNKLSGLFITIRFLFIAGLLSVSLCCSQTKVTKETFPRGPDINRTAELAQPQGTPDLTPPRADEVRDAVLRVFKNVVTIETDRDPYFTTGDFNGDRSPDLAVVVKPAPGKLPEINDELANWILVAPVQQAKSSQMVMPKAEMHAQIMRRRPVRVDEGDVLLAIIHGFQSKGWRDIWATQTYILKGAVGGEIKAQEHRQVVKASNKNKNNLPRIWGDVIAENIGGQDGFLYFNGGRYAWYDPLTYKPEPQTMNPHGRGMGAVQ